MIFLLFGFLLRLIKINQSLWLDEAISAQVAIQYSYTEIISEFMPTDFNPPLYYLVLKSVVNLFGSSEIILRSISVVSGIASVYLIYKIAKLLKIKKAKLPALLLATSPLHIYYSQEARAYSLAAFFVILMFYSFLKLKNNKKYIVSGVFFALAFMTHYLTIFSPLVLIYLTLRKEKPKKIIYFLIPFLLIFSLWLPVFRKQLNFAMTATQELSTWAQALGRPTLKNVFLFPVKFILGRTTFKRKIFMYITAVLSILVYAFLSIVGLLKSKKAKSLLVLNWLVLPLIAGFIISFITPLFTYFRFLYCLPAVYLMVSLGVSKLAGKQKKWLDRYLVILNLLILVVFFNNPGNLRENWQGAAQYLNENKQRQNIQVLAFQEFTEPLAYYHVTYTTSIKSLKKNKIYFVTYGENIIDPEHEKKARLEKLGYEYQNVVNFNSVTVEEWMKKEKQVLVVRRLTSWYN